jgi:hypothetical protein
MNLRRSSFVTHCLAKARPIKFLKPIPVTVLMTSLPGELQFNPHKDLPLVCEQ